MLLLLLLVLVLLVLVLLLLSLLRCRWLLAPGCEMRIEPPADCRPPPAGHRRSAGYVLAAGSWLMPARCCLLAADW